MNGGPGNARYSPLTQITRDNVRQLEVAWTYERGDHFTASEMQSNPIVVDGVIYVTTPTMQVVAVPPTAARSCGPTIRAAGRPRARALDIAAWRCTPTASS